MRLWRQPSRSRRRQTRAGRPASTAWPCAHRCSAAVLLLADGAPPPISRVGRITRDQFHRAGGARGAASTLDQQQHPGRPRRGGGVAGRLSAPPMLEREGVAPALGDCCTLHTPLCAGNALLFAGHELSVQERCTKVGGSHELPWGESSRRHRRGGRTSAFKIEFMA